MVENFLPVFREAVAKLVQYKERRRVFLFPLEIFHNKRTFKDVDSLLGRDPIGRYSGDDPAGDIPPTLLSAGVSTRVEVNVFSFNVELRVLHPRDPGVKVATKDVNRMISNNRLIV